MSRAVEELQARELLLGDGLIPSVPISYYGALKVGREGICINLAQVAIPEDLEHRPIKQFFLLALASWNGRRGFREYQSC